MVLDKWRLPLMESVSVLVMLRLKRYLFYNVMSLCPVDVVVVSL